MGPISTVHGSNPSLYVNDSSTSSRAGGATAPRSIITVLLPARASNLCEPALIVLVCTLPCPLSCATVNDIIPAMPLPWSLRRSRGMAGRSPGAK